MREGVTGKVGQESPSRRVGFLAVLAIVFVAIPAFAGHYLDRAALIVRQATQEVGYLEYRLGNRELARVVQKMTEARLRAAREMSVPEEVVQAHPHLLLMLESFERAASAAMEGEAARFVTHLRRGRDEEQLFRAVLRQLGFALPEEKKKR